MRRWVLKPGKTDLSGLVLQDVPTPQPGPGELRVRVLAASLNYRDQLVLSGQYGPVAQEDLVPLSDGAGVIDAVGAGVQKWSIGDHVMSVYFKDWVDGPPGPTIGLGLGSVGEPGMLSQYVILKADRVVAAPKNFTSIEAATLPCAALTAWSALNGNRPYIKRVGNGSKVLILGTGGVALFALLLGRAAGAQVFGTSGQDHKREKLRALGVVDTVNYKTTPNWGEVVFQRTGGVNLVVNAAGSGSMDQSIAAVGYGGDIALMGLLAHAESPPNLMYLMAKGATIRGVAVGGAAALADLVETLERCNIKPPIDRVFKFEEAREAYLAAVAPDLFGKIVIEIA